MFKITTNVLLLGWPSLRCKNDCGSSLLQRQGHQHSTRGNYITVNIGQNSNSITQEYMNDPFINLTLMMASPNTNQSYVVNQGDDDILIAIREWWFVKMHVNLWISSRTRNSDAEYRREFHNAFEDAKIKLLGLTKCVV